MSQSTLGPNTVSIAGRGLVPGKGLFFIAGPCVIESESVIRETAHELERVHRETGIPIVFKSSFDKANRTSVRSFRGPGLHKGLDMLAKVREETGLPIVSDIHTPDQAGPAGNILDAIQIPAFLSRQTDLLVAAARTGKAVNIKKGQFLSPDDMTHAVEKIESTGNTNIVIIERGSAFGYRDVVVDMRSIVRLKRFGYPVVFDATHSAQLPGRGEGCSDGDRSLVPPLARAAVAAGADGLFIETHPAPERALCDGPNSLALSDFAALVSNLAQIYDLVPRRAVEGGGVRTAAPGEAPDGPTMDERLKRVRLLIFDVDGALTDGRIILGSGDLELKSFHVRDGHGIKLASRAGLEIAIITGRSSEVVAKRAQELSISHVYQGAKRKRPLLLKLMQDLNLEADQVAMLGDDVVDIPILREIGLGVTVPEAPSEVRQAAHYVTTRPGGDAAARELIEMILKAQGKWDQVMARYYE